MIEGKRPVRRIACVGEVMIELVAQDDDTARLGVAGDTYNTAVYLTRALRGSGIEVSYVTALGTDPFSERIFAALARHGLDTSFVERRDGAMPGLYAIDTDETGERSFSYWRSASAARTLFSEPCDIGLDALAGFDLVLLSGISMAILPVEVRARLVDYLRGFRASGGVLAYDSNYRPRLWDSAETARAVNRDLWSLSDIALPSADDEMALFGDPSPQAVRDRLLALGARDGALKCGGDGPIDLATGVRFAPSGPPVTVVDTTAAGDSFNAGYLATRVLGGSTMDALKAGHALACRVIGTRGAILPEDGDAPD